MVALDHSGNAIPTTLTAQIGPADTSATIADPTGWPSGGVDGEFVVTFSRDTSIEERVRVGSRTGGTLSGMVRGVDGTTAATHPVDADAEHTFSAFEAAAANDHIEDATVDDHTQYMRADGTRHDLTARHAVGTSLAAGVPLGLLVGDAAAEGDSIAVARQNHVHGVPTGVPTGSVAAAAAAGVSTSVPRLDHVHDIADGAIDASTLLANAIITFAHLTAAAIDSIRNGCGLGHVAHQYDTLDRSSVTNGSSDYLVSGVPISNTRDYMVTHYTECEIDGLTSWQAEFRVDGVDTLRLGRFEGHQTSLGVSSIHVLQGTKLWQPNTSGSFDLDIEFERTAGTATMTLKGSGVNLRGFCVWDIGPRS